MLSLQGILDLLNDRVYKTPEHIYQWQRIYYGMSLHIDGICPAYKPLRYTKKGYELATKFSYPVGYGGAWYQEIFDEKLFSRHPREPEITRQWRLSQYKPFTKAPFAKVIQTVIGAIFQDSAYSINIENKDDNDYIWGNNFQGKNLVQFIVDKFQNIGEDPNAVFVTIPKYSARETSNNVEPDVYFIPSKVIRWHTDDEIVFSIGELMWAVNRYGYFRFRKDEQDNWVNYDGENGGYYQHLMGYRPVVKAGGLWNAQGYYDSWFDAAKAIADEFVSAKSAEQMVNKEASHPYIVEADTDCTDCAGTGKIEEDCSCGGNGCNICNGHPRLLTCDTCNGLGKISRNPADRLIVPAKEMGNNLIQFINPDVTINKFHVENNAALYKAMMDALHLSVIDQAQSGAAKAMDMETRYLFVSMISNDIFGRLIPRIIDTILSLRNITVNSNGDIVPTTGQYTIVKPTNFQIKTSYDLLIEYTEAAKDLPDFMLTEYLIALADKQFGGNDALKRKTALICKLDTLALKKDGDIQIIAVNNWKPDRDIQFHYELPKIIDTIISDWGEERFNDATQETIEAEINNRFASIKPPPIEIQPTAVDVNRV